MKELKNEVIENFSFSNEQLKKFIDKKVMFSGEICSKCKVYVNVPRLKKYWECYNCRTVNDFDFVHITLPFVEPEAEPSKRRIEYPLSYSSMHNQWDFYNGEFW